MAKNASQTRDSNEGFLFIVANTYTETAMAAPIFADVSFFDDYHHRSDENVKNQ